MLGYRVMYIVSSSSQNSIQLSGAPFDSTSSSLNPRRFQNVLFRSSFHMAIRTRDSPGCPVIDAKVALLACRVCTGEMYCGWPNKSIPDNVKVICADRLTHSTIQRKSRKYCERFSMTWKYEFNKSSLWKMLNILISHNNHGRMLLTNWWHKNLPNESSINIPFFVMKTICWLFWMCLNGLRIFSGVQKNHDICMSLKTNNVAKTQTKNTTRRMYAMLLWVRGPRTRLSESKAPTRQIIISDQIASERQEVSAQRHPQFLSPFKALILSAAF